MLVLRNSEQAYRTPSFSSGAVAATLGAPLRASESHVVGIRAPNSATDTTFTAQAVRRSEALPSTGQRGKMSPCSGLAGLSLHSVTMRAPSGVLAHVRGLLRREEVAA
jgi:hypothetical protein